MREKKWTPGPWVRPDDGRENIVIMPEPANIGYGHKYAVCGGGNHHANAALISAAPELVKEVEKSCIRCSWQDDFMGSDIANCPQVKTCGKAKALAKAYGEVAP